MSPILPRIDARPIDVAREDGPLRLAVFGAGKAAKFHLAAIDQLSGVSVAGVCSRSGTTAEALVAGRPGAIATSDQAELIDADRIDAAIVAVSHDHTAAIAGELLDAGIPVLVEKPAALTSVEVDDLARRAAATGTLGLVAVNRRYFSYVQQALAIVNQRGPIRGVVVEGHERTDSLLRQRDLTPDDVRRWFTINSIHYVDLLRLVGGSVTEVQSMVEAVRVPAGDHLIASMRFESGALGTFVAHWNSTVLPSVRIYGDEVLAQVQLLPPEEAFAQFHGKRRIKLKLDRADELAKPGVLEQDAAFLRAVANGQTSAPFPASDLADHAETLRLVEAILAGRR